MNVQNSWVYPLIQKTPIVVAKCNRYMRSKEIIADWRYMGKLNEMWYWLIGQRRDRRGRVYSTYNSHWVTQCTGL